MPLSTSVKWAIATPALLVLGYAGFFSLLLIPSVQRHVLYVHKINTSFWHDIRKPESFGFARRQIRLFNATTPDGETLFGWHVLPLDVYAEHRAELLDDPQDDDLTLQLLRSDPGAKVLISFHGNAGHIAQGWRTDTYRAFSALPRTHVFTIDYRGFGHSTGAPTEAGLITDGISLVHHVLDLGIPPARIAIIGQSLGTAVASAVALHFADPLSHRLPALPSFAPCDVPGTERSETPKYSANQTMQVLSETTFGNSSESLTRSEERSRTLFAGITLIAPFTNIPNLLLTYKAGGFLPLLGPFRPFKFLHPVLHWGMTEPWPTLLRLQDYFSAATSPYSGAPGETSQGGQNGPGGVHIVHAYNDADISFRQSVQIYEKLTDKAAVQAEKKRALVLEADINGTPLTVEFVEHGGHNRVCTYSEVHLAVRRQLQFKRPQNP